MIVEERASTILCNFLRSNCAKDKGAFILPSNICCDVYFVFLKAGIPVLFLDLETDNLGLDLKQLARQLGQGEIQGVLYHHSYGNEYTPIEELRKIRSEHPNIFIIDDRCLCIPQLEESASSSDVFDLILFSTGYAKVAELQYGGFAFNNERCRYQFEKLPIQENAYQALKSHYTEINQPDTELTRLAQGDWLVSQLSFDTKGTYTKDVEEAKQGALTQKESLNQIYRDGIQSPLHLGSNYNTWRFQIMVENKQELLDEIFSEGLFASGHYESIGSKMHLGDYPITEHLHRSVVNLFNDHYFSIEQSQALINIIQKTGRPATGFENLL